MGFKTIVGDGIDNNLGWDLPKLLNFINGKKSEKERCELLKQLPEHNQDNQSIKKVKRI